MDLCYKLHGRWIVWCSSSGSVWGKWNDWRDSMSAQYVKAHIVIIGLCCIYWQLEHGANELKLHEIEIANRKDCK